MNHQPEKQLTPELLQMIGASLVSLIGVQHSMGHSSAGGTARDYLNCSDLTGPEQLVRDVLAAGTGGSHEPEDERIAQFVEEYGIGRKIAAAVMW